MSKRIRGYLSNLSNLHITIILIAFTVFLLSGGLYDLAMQPEAVIPTETNVIFIYPYQLHEQLLNESFGIFILYSLGTLGLFLIYRSTRSLGNPRQVNFLIGIGLILFILSLLIVEAILNWKLYPTL